MIMEKTLQGLAEAFAGESQANRKYTAYAAQAEKEGYKQAAKLFRAAAEAETIHALTHLKNMGKIKSTKENLADAIAGETHEYQIMYPEFIEHAQAENQAAALRGFKFAAGAEEVHANLYKKALANIDNEVTTDLYLCTICGHIHEGTAPDVCPICMAKAQAFKIVN